ncbi:MAG: glycosyltransferase, partial [Flavobacteriaceae bacterium]|nr:glycosyltransferase [Flavobacteriaceae bacterium]
MAELVSIIIPTYDRMELLSRTLESIMMQRYSNFEIIVIDDGSPNDQTQNLCSAYPKVRYHRIDNSGGPAVPRNKGIRSAKGEFIAFVDDDDLWREDKLSKQMAIFDSNPDTDLVHGCCQGIDEDGELLDEIIGRPGDPAEKTGKVHMRMVGNWTLMTSSVIVRKSLVDKVGYFNEDMPAAGEDMEYWVRCSFQGSFFYMDQPLVYYRKHEGISDINSKKYLDLPGYLMQVVTNMKNNQLINANEFNQLRRQLV